MQWPVQGRNYQGAEAHRRWHSVDGGLCVVCGSCWHHSLKAGGCLARVCDWAGKRWAQHQPKPVLHHAGAHTMVGWQAHNLWPRVFRDDGCEEARLGQDRRTRQVRRRGGGGGGASGGTHGLLRARFVGVCCTQAPQDSEDCISQSCSVGTAFVLASCITSIAWHTSCIHLPVRIMHARRPHQR